MMSWEGMHSYREKELVGQVKTENIHMLMISIGSITYTFSMTSKTSYFILLTLLGWGVISYVAITLPDYLNPISRA